MRNSKFLLRHFPLRNFLPRELRSVNFFLAAASPQFFSRHFRFLKFLLATILLFFLSPVARAQSAPLQKNDSERQLFEALNRARLAQGLSALRWDDVLFKAARLHALRMMNLNRLEHQLPGEPNLEERLTQAGARFSVIAENIAVGPNPETIHSGWMDSPGHRRNILDVRVDSVGIAVVRGTGGLFAVQDFSHTISNLSVEQQEQAVAALLVARGFQISGAADEARKSCESHEPAPGSRVRSMMWFETTDLTALPEQVERKLQTTSYRRATVGACHAKNDAGFSHFRIAVLLF
jgi:uncharacterized protein YkwD